MKLVIIHTEFKVTAIDLKKELEGINPTEIIFIVESMLFRFKNIDYIKKLSIPFEVHHLTKNGSLKDFKNIIESADAFILGCLEIPTKPLFGTSSMNSIWDIMRYAWLNGKPCKLVKVEKIIRINPRNYTSVHKKFFKTYIEEIRDRDRKETKTWEEIYQFEELEKYPRMDRFTVEYKRNYEKLVIYATDFDYIKSQLKRLMESDDTDYYLEIYYQKKDTYAKLLDYNPYMRFGNETIPKRYTLKDLIDKFESEEDNMSIWGVDFGEVPYLSKFYYIYRKWGMSFGPTKK